jgi:tetratricopeptide (TPR) repeat protein
MTPSESVPPTASWRKQHPVLSRTLLYALGLGLIAVLVYLYQARQAVDDQDRLRALAEEMDALSIVHAIDPDGSMVLKLLDDKFMDPTFPAKLRGRALRWRALALRKQHDPVPVEAALEAADALALEPGERLALKLEWAEARLEASDVEGALAVLPTQAAVAPLPPLALLRALLFARAEEASGRSAAGYEVLEAALDDLQAPVDAYAEVYVGGREWTCADAATVATEVLARLDGAKPTDLWRRLVRLAPRDFDALLASTRAFLGLGLETDARATWERVRRLDPRKADAEARRDSALRALGR